MAHQFNKKTDIDKMLQVTAKGQPFEMTPEATFKVTVHNYLSELMKDKLERNEIIDKLHKELANFGIRSRMQAIYYYTNFIKDFSPINIFDYYDSLVETIIENLLSDRERELAKGNEASGKVLTEINKTLATVLEKLAPKKPAFDPGELNLPGIRFVMDASLVGSTISRTDKEFKERIKKYYDYGQQEYTDFEDVGEKDIQE